MFTARNAALVAVVQTGVIVIGTLAAGVSSKVWADAGVPLPTATWVLLNCGMLLFLVPLVWISVAMSVHQRTLISEDAKDLAFWSGTVILLGLIVFEVYAIFRPFMSLCFMGTSFEME